MSTFDGIVDEFPEIRIDYFRNHPNKRQPALCFLSHVHSDHLLGLDTLKMPFVYCSAVTRKLLLKMEKYPHRINFAKGILEARKQTYKHLKSILRPLPLHTPITLEVGPGSHIRVTLFDANHCPGAVMFLIEGHERTILYTGDVRAEPWWVNSILRNPLLIPYTSGQKCLDCIYLDTTFASHHDVHRQFPTKAEGLAELLHKIAEYPADSVFYFRAWTLGYEDVWVAMSNFLSSQVHIDQYQLRLFRATCEDGLAADPGPALAGFRVGNSEQPGCLTLTSDVKIHSCEPGLPCHSSLSKASNVVWVTPIISRMPDGTEVAEVGAGGGRGDLYQSRELEIGSDAIFQALQLLISTLAVDRDAANKLENLIRTARDQQDHRIILDGLGVDPHSDLSVENFVKSLLNSDISTQSTTSTKGPAQRKQSKVIHFPYSRHSSYSELCALVKAFQPKDICPCTVDLNSWNEDVSIESLFGELCSTSRFKYDQLIRHEVQQRHKESATTQEGAISQQQDTQRTETQTASQVSNDSFGSVGEHTVDDIELDDKPQTQVQIEEEQVVVRIQHAWLDINDGLDTRRTRKSVACPSGVDDEVASTSSEATTVVEMKSCSAEADLSECTEELGDLPDGERTAIRSGRRLRILGDGTTSEIDETESSFTSMYTNDSINIDRRKEAFNAARACLEDGDTTRWSALDIRSWGSRGHQIGSPEL